MNIEEAAQDQRPEVEQLVDALVDGQVAKYVLDTDTANALIREIAAETGLPRAAVRIAFKLLAPMLVKQTQAGVGWVGRKLAAKSAGALACMPGYGLVAGKLMVLRAKLDEDVARREQLEAILAGDRPATDIEHAEGLSKELRVGLRQLGELEAMHAHVDARFDEVLTWLNPQPPLTLKLLERNETNRLKFGARRVPFLGRQTEMTRLRKFLETDKPFSWWLMTGSGGQGKSRLALELCLRAGTAWRAGFLREPSPFDAWDIWQPESATLIVVDYVATRPEHVRGIITSLLNREHTDPLDAPVRLLLAERSNERSWWEKLISSDQTGYVIEQSQFAAEPLDLGPMTDNDLWRTIASVLTDAGKPLPDRAETVAALSQIDPEGRPLFAAFAADALVNGGNIRGWDQHRLLRDVVHRERQCHWAPAGVTQSYENLLCIATMTGGPPVSMLANPPVGIELPNLEAFDPKIYEVMTGTQLQGSSDGGERLLPVLQPDIVGEFFVLEHLKPLHFGTNQPAERFRHAAWNLHPVGALFFTAFLDRSKDDFLDHHALPLLLVPPEDAPHQQSFWALVAVNLISAYGRVGRFNDAEAVLDRLRRFERNHAERAEIRLCLANGARSLCTLYGNTGRVDDARGCFDLLKQLKADHPEETEVRLELSKAAVNLISACGNVGQLAEARQCLVLLKQLAADHPGEHEMRLRLAQGAFNLSIAYGNAGQLGGAENQLASLKQLGADYPDEPEIRLYLGKTAWNLLNIHANAREFAKSVGCLTLLQQLVADCPGEAEVRLHLAQGAVKLTRVCDETSQVERAQSFWALLVQLAADHTDDVGLRLELAKGTVNLMCTYCKVGQLTEAETCLALLNNLAAEHPNEAEIRVRLARGAANLTNGYANAARMVEAEACLALLIQLEADHPDEAEVRLELAKGAVNLTYTYTRAGQLASAEACLALLKRLDDHVNETEVRLRLAQGTVNLISAYGNARQLVEAEACLRLLQQLEADHGDEVEVRLYLAKGVFNLIVTYTTAGQLDKAGACLALLERLEADNIGEQGVRLELAKGTVNLITAYGNAGRLSDAVHCWTILQQAAADHREEPEVRLWLAKGTINLITPYGNAERFEDAVACITLLQQLEAAHWDEPGIPLCLTKGAVNLIAAYGRAGRLAEAEVYLTLLIQLEIKHREVPEIRLELAKVAVSMIVDRGNAGCFEEACPWFELLQELASDHANEVELRLHLARSAVNLMTKYCNVGQQVEAAACLVLLAQLATNHPDEAEVRLELGKGAFNAINFHLKDRQPDKARRVALEARDALMSPEFKEALRQQFGEEAAVQFLAWICSLPDG